LDDDIGVRLVTDEVIIVEKFMLARLLGMRSVDGSLFHQQETFPSHRSLELPFQEAIGIWTGDSQSMRPGAPCFEETVRWTEFTVNLRKHDPSTQNLSREN
jgi:hypothetical protein